MRNFEDQLKKLYNDQYLIEHFFYEKPTRMLYLGVDSLGESTKNVIGLGKYYK